VSDVAVPRKHPLSNQNEEESLSKLLLRENG